MKLQEVMNIIVSGLKAQKWQKSTAYYGSCAYFGEEEDTHCAVGHLLKGLPEDMILDIKENYNCSDTHQLLRNIGSDLPSELQEMFNEHLSFLQDMQVFHDSRMLTDPESDDLREGSKQQLDSIAKMYEVEVCY